MDAFNTTREPVLPVTGPAGAETVGMAEALARANDVQLALPDAMDETDVLRLLLAIVIDALGQPRDSREWADWWERGSFDTARLDQYFALVADRFDLFGPQPAWQVADLEAVSGERKPSSLLIPAAASGNNVPLFSSRTESDPPLMKPSEAFFALLRVHAWDTAAIKTGAVGDPAVKGGKTTGNRTGQLGALGVVIPKGPTLFETLMLNTPVAQRIRTMGTPWWRRPPETPEWRERRPDGLLDVLTWQSRRVRLFPETTPDGHVVIREVLVCAGDRMPSTPEFLEIHTAWRTVENPKAGQPGKTPVRHQSGKSLWRGMGSLMAVHDVDSATPTEPPVALAQLGDLWADDTLSADYPLGVLAVGVDYGNQSAVVDNVYVDSLPMPISALGVSSQAAAALRDCAAQAEQLRRALNDLGNDIRRATGAASVPWDKGDHPGDRMMALLDDPFRQLLRNIQRDPGMLPDAMDEWKRVARDIAIDAAGPVLASAPPVGFLGRGEAKKHITVPQAETFFRAKVQKLVGSVKEEV